MTGTPMAALRRRRQRFVLAVYRRLPISARLVAIRALTPSFHVGALCVIEREDGALLLLRQSYRRREAWGFPGGLLKRGEEPYDAVRREVREELGVAVEVEDAPMVVVDARHRRVDVVFKGRLARSEDAPLDKGAPPDDAADPGAAAADRPPPTPSSPEIVEVRWFAPNELPILLPEAATALVELARATRPEVEDE